MLKITIPFVVISILLAAQPKSEAQLSGEYSFEIADIFQASPYCFSNGFLGVGWSFQISYVDFNYNTWVSFQKFLHNPRTGDFVITGSANVTDGLEGVYSGVQAGFFKTPSDSDSWRLTATPTRVLGRTYTDKITKQSLLDISSGIIGLVGFYTPEKQKEAAIAKGSLAFRAKGVSCYAMKNSDPTPTLKLIGSATLRNKRTIKFNLPNAYIGGLDFGGAYFSYESTDGASFRSGLKLDLNVSTAGSDVSGSAKIYYYLSGYAPTESAGTYTQYPDPELPAKEFIYSIKGTSVNGVATLNLVGQGVIKGLKATIYINEATEEIVQNGKNSITLYGQTITY